MADEETAVGGDTGSVDEAAPSPSESSSVEESKPEEVAEVKPEGEEESTEVNSQSERAQSRQQELANKVREKAEEVESLRAQLEQYKASVQPPTGPEAIRPPLTDVQGDVELTIEDYNRDIMRAADQLVTLRLSQQAQAQERMRKLDEGLRVVENKYAELNPDSDKFDPDLSAKVTELYSKAAKANPDVDIRDFAETVMEIRNKGETEGKLNASKSLADQAATGAVAPSGDTTDRKTSEEDLISKIKSGEISIKEAEKLLK